MDDHIFSTTQSDRLRALITSTVAFTACFALWTIFSIIGIKIQKTLLLNETEFGLLIAMPILMGSISRIFLGIWTDQFGGRLIFTVVMLISAVFTWFIAFVTHYYSFLLMALGIGLAGGSFAVGVAYVSSWYPTKQQGTALGIFGVGNVGAAVTNFCAPFLLVSFGGWQGVVKIYAVAMVVIAIAYWFTTKDDPALVYRKKNKLPRPDTITELVPLKKLQVWRFSLYYFFVFGAFVALALWLPKYYMHVYKVNIEVAGTLSALYTAPGSVFRAFGGWLSDRYGARRVMYWTFIASGICTFFLSYPSTEYIIHGIHTKYHFHIAMGIVPFTILTFILGFFMSLGKAAVYKHIPVYYPKHVGSVGGIVGLIGGLGGFILPVTFGSMDDLVGIWNSCFMLLFAITMISLIWMHFAIRSMEKRKHPDLGAPQFLPELGEKSKGNSNGSYQ